MTVNNGSTGNFRTVPDADDIAGLWIDTSLGDPLTQQVINRVPIGKPKDFFRVHPDPSYRQVTELYTHKTETTIEPQYYIIGPSMRGRIEEARPCVLVCVVDRAGSPRLWPIPRPRDGENDNDAWISARAAARQSADQWVRLLWVRRAYETRVAQPGYAPDPDFSKLPPFEELVRLAFGTHGIIRSEDHPIFRELFGIPTEAPDVAEGF